jgi:hypothetical protein
MKTIQIIYWLATILLCIILLFSAGMYLFNYESVEETFNSLGFPTYLIYPMAIAKIFAVGVLVLIKKSIVRDWAYAGLFFDFLLAMFAHIMVEDGQQMLAIIAMLLLIISYVGHKKMINAI